MDDTDLEERKKAIQKFALDPSSDEGVEEQESMADANVEPSQDNSEVFGRPEEASTIGVQDISPVFEEEKVDALVDAPIDNKNEETTHSEKTMPDFEEVASIDALYEPKGDSSPESRSSRVKFLILALIIVIAVGAVIKFVVLKTDMPAEYASIQKPTVAEIVENGPKMDSGVGSSLVSIQTLSVDNAESEKLKEEMKILEDALKNQQKEIARLESGSSTLKRQISQLEYQKNKLSSDAKKKAAEEQAAKEAAIKAELARRLEAAQPKAKATTDVWKIHNVQGEGAEITVNMVGTDRYLTVNIGDTLMDVGRISSIKQQDGKWILVGTNKLVSQ